VTSVFVVIEFYQPLYSDKEHKTVDKVFASRAKAEQYVSVNQELRKTAGIDSYWYEIEETGFDSSL
jgi:hypothetical protein